MKPFRFSIGACLLLCAVLFTGCASPAQPKGMIAHQIPHTSASRDPVAVIVTGGHKTNPAWTSAISSEDFQTALVESLRQSNIFRSVQAGGAAAYQLSVRLDSLEQPLIGFDMTVSLRSDWTLTRSSDGLVLWTHPLYSTYTATVGDAFVGVERLRLANEGAARQNIEQGLAQLAELKLVP